MNELVIKQRIPVHIIQSRQPKYIVDDFTESNKNYYIEFNKDALIYLYRNDDWSVSKIANFFGISKTLLTFYFRKWGVSVMKEKAPVKNLKVTNRWLAQRGPLKQSTVNMFSRGQRKMYLYHHKDYFIYLNKVENWSLSRIAKAFGLSNWTIQTYFKEWGVEVQRPVHPKTKIILENKKWIIDKYTDKENPLALSQMADKLGVDSSTLSNKIRDWGCPLRGHFKPKTHVILKNKNNIIELYTRKENPLTTQQIADKIGIAGCTIQLRLKEWGIPARNYEKATPSEVKRLYDLELTPEEIAERLDVDSGTVYKVLVTKFGIHHTKKNSLTVKELRILKYLYGSRRLAVPQVTRIMRKRFRRLKDVSETIIRARIKETPGLRLSVEPDLTDEELMHAFGLLSEKKSFKEIGDEIEISPIKVQKELNKFKSVRYPTQKSLTDHVKEKIIYLRKKKLSNFKIAIIVKSTPTVIFSFLRSKEVPAPNTYSEEQKLIFVNQIRELRKDPKNTVLGISKIMNVSNSMVARLIRDYKIPKVKRVFNPEVQAKIRELYLKETHYSDIAKKLNLKTESVRQEIGRMGLKVIYKPFAREYSPRATAYQNNLIRIMYGSPYYFSMFKIADIIQIDKTTVKARLIKLKIPIRSADQARIVRRRKHKIYNIKRINYKLLKERI
jgi:transcriptional regulator with XRE-family HTH domain/AraC-like DNA-binding protein/predicted transcriptional regulator